MYSNILVGGRYLKCAFNNEKIFEYQYSNTLEHFLASAI